MHSALITETDLKEWTGYNRRSDLEEMLRKRGIPVIYGKGGSVCTTMDAINRSMLGNGPANQITPEFE